MEDFFCLFRFHKKNPLDWMQVGHKSEGLSLQQKVYSCCADSHHLGSISKEWQTETEVLDLQNILHMEFQSAGGSKSGRLSVCGGRIAGHLHVHLRHSRTKSRAAKPEGMFLGKWKMQPLLGPLLCTLKWTYCIQQLAFCSVLKDQLFQWKKKKSHTYYLLL